MVVALAIVHRELFRHIIVFDSNARHGAIVCPEKKLPKKRDPFVANNDIAAKIPPLGLDAVSSNVFSRNYAGDAIGASAARMIGWVAQDARCFLALSYMFRDFQQHNISQQGPQNPSEQYLLRATSTERAINNRGRRPCLYPTIRVLQ